mmetsp:Transcript_13342/g.15475  ORF Transcript_13342/g.15475 Transcript_13342/m.15475 type:complete len:96 (+) Transcript_13342:165-452(+)|eukprot:CAMPEP_0168333360 /NCGR_PEP_ID=MMETSP0213-20121227/9565_1 /TAXON_ID=151035 /ORGANISM="Euplotes harpa, Strain FSP1.4" /LENGTH=95 /DNA_ID=CAMNT_0008337677 /DNA_START=630 /DNA_END=917 /DNA_ORIENTATION=+
MNYKQFKTVHAEMVSNMRLFSPAEIHDMTRVNTIRNKLVGRLNKTSESPSKLALSQAADENFGMSSMFSVDSVNTQSSESDQADFEVQNQAEVSI